MMCQSIGVKSRRSRWLPDEIRSQPDDNSTKPIKEINKKERKFVVYFNLYIFKFYKIFFFFFYVSDNVLDIVNNSKTPWVSPSAVIFLRNENKRQQTF